MLRGYLHFFVHFAHFFEGARQRIDAISELYGFQVDNFGLGSGILHMT
jgi:hypothetical protein